MTDRIRNRPLGLCALVLLAAEALASARAGPVPALSLTALVIAPGLALAILLPQSARTWTGVLAAAPALGIAASSIAVIAIATVGIPLTGVSVRLALAAIALVALVAIEGPEVADRVDRRAVGVTLALLAVVAVAVLLQERVIGGAPVPGNDWGKYLLYAEEIAERGGLLIDNPYWMLGAPFREDPAAPGLLASFLVLTGLPAAVLVHAIWAFAIAGVLSTFAFVRTFWGDAAGLLAAGLVAVLPISHDILGWHGLPNAAALALFPIVLLYLTRSLDHELSIPEATGLALVAVALGAAHRFSLLVLAAATLFTFVVALIALGSTARRRFLKSALRAAVAAAAISPAVIYDLVTRQRTFGGTQDHTAYLTAKVDVGLVASDLTYVFTAAAVVAILLAARWSRGTRTLWPLLCTLAAIVVLAYGWLFALPLVYFRMAYFLPLVLAPLVAITLTRIWRPRVAAAIGIVLVATIAGFAWGQARNVREFYAFANTGSLRALDALEAQLAPGEAVVTDRCWSFLGTWLLHTPTLAALEPEDIQPKAEVTRARQAHAILEGGPEGRALASKLGVRYQLVSPSCPDVEHRAERIPARSVPVFVSERLVVLRLAQPTERRRRAGRPRAP